MDIYKKLKISIANLEKLRKNTITITKEEAIALVQIHEKTQERLKSVKQSKQVEVIKTVERHRPRDRDGGTF